MKRVARTAIKMAKDEGYATFYNTDDPRKDIDDIFAKFKANNHVRFMTLGGAMGGSLVCTLSGSADAGAWFLEQSRCFGITSHFVTP